MKEPFRETAEIVNQRLADEAALRERIYTRTAGSAFLASATNVALAYEREMERARRLYSDVASSYSQGLSRLTDSLVSATRAYQRVMPDVSCAERAYAQLQEQMKGYAESTGRACAQLSTQMNGFEGSVAWVAEHLREQMRGFEGAAVQAVERLRRDAASLDSAVVALRDIRLVDVSLVKSCIDRADFVNPLKKLVTYAAETENISTICNTVSALAKLETQSAPRNIHLNTDGTVSVDGQVRSMQAVEEALIRVVDSLVEKRITPELGDIQARLEQIQPDSLLRQVVVDIVVGILVWIICTFTLQPMINAVLQMRAKVNAKTAVRAVRETLLFSEEDVATRGTLRIVVSDILPVNAGRRHRSQILGWLYPGDVVLLVDKRKGWSLVEFRNRDGQTVLRGWVRSKYLCRI